MENSDDLRVGSQSKLDILLYVAATVYDQEYGPHDDDKSKTTGEEETEMEARIFGDKVPRKNRVHRSPPSSRKTVTPWTRVIEQQRSELQNPNPESEPSSSSCVTQFKKRLHDDDQIISRKKLRIFHPLEAEPIQTSPPDWLLKAMRREENGYNPKLISTRKLYKTDLDKIQGRLSVPFKQLKNPDFLTEEEIRIIDEQAMKLRKEGVSVDLVDPQMKKHALELRKWKMSGNWNYVFVVGWNDVVAANGFEVDDFFPLWSFRSGRGKLCFALVPPTEASHGGDGASTSGECSYRCSSLDDSQHL
ncbi:PREDICTED: putative B3 domain-containing protein At2g27410 [Camelina sativa]|uniref:B3 domain-containing protein At2g27410 n=1 Tax=Camelina sativa TaxID=90675 RepID=A0ABM0WNY1_CAMSA|nr:PREDICTED: putative B3 domain-containing protein At2g27410 [Camelina sativa]